ncbi:DUF998 domain-containing protein [Salinadaptatus halalkaliphilus]|uniref:DUF998 domain-containing protein n=1 Tax=Salinadaptatus halalkaliphilus TaxID=2419781 RepID=A0A4S3TJC3_9EURY|nr:Yip1 family protein [Salinadaptatus halalkaliphilus]THE64189.1 DUF998 domain-containing protein [Salinadaptatus halalkaliphilus]
MTSLTEAYKGNEREVTSLRRLYAGTALVLLGAALSVVAVVIATTDLLVGVVGDHYAAVRVAGVLAGLGVPAALVGVFIVLPAGRRVRATAAISASLCLLGVALFWHAYPYHWRGYGDDLTLHVSVVYLLGLFIAVWCLFTAVVNFKTRNDPGGMLEMNVTRRNQTIVEYEEPEPDSGGHGGIGFFGSTPDGDVETQTNAQSESATDADTEPELDDGAILTEQRSSTQSRSRGSASKRGPSVGTPTSDGGSTTADISSPLDGDGRDAEIVESSPDEPSNPADRYCGNCRHFEYVRSSSGMVPYCARHERAMDDMDACEEWTPNSR